MCKASPYVQSRQGRCSRAFYQQCRWRPWWSDTVSGYPPCSSSVLKFTLSAQTFNSAFDSLQDHVMVLDLCLWGRAGVMKISDSKSILMTHRLCVSLLTDRTGLLRLGRTVTLTFSPLPLWISLGHLGEFCLISLDNQSITISHSVPSQRLNTISVQLWRTGREVSDCPSGSDDIWQLLIM